MFNYNPDTHHITRESGEFVGLYIPDSQQVALHVELSNVHKGKLKAGLIEAGLEVKGFEKGEPIEDKLPAEVVDIPPCPPEDLRYGDKTPSVVAWFKEHNPDEFARKYANRKTHLG